VIYEQQLGLSWNSPSEDTFRPLDASFFHEAGESEFSTLEELDAAYKRLEVSDNATNELDPDRRESLALKFKDQKGLSKSVKRMLELLCNEAGFLVYL
jgi:dynein regulatory complex protein 1